ncbi:MAG: multidrug ABC transporter substrate-binding protein [Candidatus Xenobia bacterium]|jgi:putative ABC transport system permease protein
MTWYLTLRIAFRALLRNGLRTFLTMLGMIIGVAAVISMLAIGTGAQQSVSASIASLGTNTLIIMAGSSTTGGVRSGAGGRSTLTADDVQSILEECSAVGAATPMTQQGAQIVYQNQNWFTQVSGGGVDYPQVRNWPVVEGRFFTEDEVRVSAKVCVLGRVVADNLFAGDDPLDKVIRIRNVPMRVIGVLSEKGDSAFGGSQDDVILVPYTTAMRRIFRQDSLRTALVSARTPEDVERAKQQMTALLRERHKLAEGEEDDFTIRSQAEFAQAADESTRVFTMLLGGIASVSLLVGGIGIMNIMLVSVTERIREIGIRMALGARGKDILLQFLVEAVVISLLGGALGVALGYGVALLSAAWSQWPPVVTPGSIILAFGFSAVVGVFFGLYPAVKASQLDPIEALRHE